MMRLKRSWAAPLAMGGFLAVSAASHATSCTTQAEMSGPDRDALAAMGQRLGTAVVQLDLATLQSALLPEVASQWDGMRQAVEYNAPVVKGGQAQLRSLYALDATQLTAAADTQFFCSSGNGSMTVTITLRQLPAGRYAVVLADAAGAPMAGQMAFILGFEGGAWKLGGVFIRPGMLEGHDGVWYWDQARQAVQGGTPWAAYYLYETARYLSLPVDIIASPNMEKLGQEEAQIPGSPANAFPYNVTAGDRTWKIDSIRADPSLREPDLGVTYESTGVTDPAAQRTEATAVLSALLKAKPELRKSFHGMWAYASIGGKETPVMELPMGQIP
ncbi:MAG TPA: hypothetical protein VG267_20470 [Terracidiphilus sp.]|jgi:hypothetical protein|nr:hypothetical protein [Terracidiphilus sp.]